MGTEMLSLCENSKKKIGEGGSGSGGQVWGGGGQGGCEWRSEAFMKIQKKIWGGGVGSGGGVGWGGGSGWMGTEK